MTPAKQTGKSTTPLRYVKEVRSQGKPHSLKLYRQTGEYREVQLTEAETHDQKSSQEPVPG